MPINVLMVTRVGEKRNGCCVEEVNIVKGRHYLSDYPKKKRDIINNVLVGRKKRDREP
jgi:hypothetical protein